MIYKVDGRGIAIYIVELNANGGKRMKRRPMNTMRLTLAMGLMALAGLTVSRAQPTEIPFHAGSKVRFASIEEAAALLGAADPWVRTHSPFDHSARAGRSDDPGQAAFLPGRLSRSRRFGGPSADGVDGPD